MCMTFGREESVAWIIEMVALTDIAVLLQCPSPPPEGERVPYALQRLSLCALKSLRANCLGNDVSVIHFSLSKVFPAD